MPKVMSVCDVRYMRFGKHKDKPHSEVPTSYLHWAVGVGAVDAEHMADELRRRGEEPCPIGAKATDSPTRSKKKKGKKQKPASDGNRQIAGGSSVASDYTLPPSSPHDISMPWEPLTDVDTESFILASIIAQAPAG